MRKLKLETVQVLYQEYTYSGNFKNKGHKEARKLSWGSAQRLVVHSENWLLSSALFPRLHWLFMGRKHVQISNPHIPPQGIWPEVFLSCQFFWTLRTEKWRQKRCNSLLFSHCNPLPTSQLQLPDLVNNNNAGFPIKFEFQIIFSVGMSQILPEKDLC
jgi:hypothetical protein